MSKENKEIKPEYHLSIQQRVREVIGKKFDESIFNRIQLLGSSSERMHSNLLITAHPTFKEETYRYEIGFIRTNSNSEKIKLLRIAENLEYPEFKFDNLSEDQMLLMDDMLSQMREDKSIRSKIEPELAINGYPAILLTVGKGIQSRQDSAVLYSIKGLDTEAAFYLVRGLALDSNFKLICRHNNLNKIFSS